MREEALLFGEAGSLVGIITDPPEPNAGEDIPAVIVLNQGVMHRVGFNRLHVKMARRLAAMGFVVLRFDFSGIGDSSFSMDTLPFKGRSVTETQEAMDCLGELRGKKRFILMGICSGAVISFETAGHDPRVVGVVQINPQSYDDTLSAFVEARRGRYWKAVLLNPSRWLRPLTGKADYKMLGMRLRGLFTRKRRASSIALKLAAEFRSLTDRGVNLLAVYGSRDWGLDYFDMMFADVNERLPAGPKPKVETIHQTDHIFTPLRAQEQLFTVVQNWANQFMPSQLQGPQMGVPKVRP